MHVTTKVYGTYIIFSHMHMYAHIYMNIHICTGSTDRKEVVVWEYTPSCSVCVHQSPSSQAHIETLTYSEYIQLYVEYVYLLSGPA